jgi:hypothetical protein
VVAIDPPHTPLTRFVRLLLLVLGLGVVVFLVWHEGVRVVMRMLVRVGWTFPAIVGIYAVHVAIRAVALWRTMISAVVRYVEVLRIRLSGEAVEMLTFTGPFLAEPAKGWLLTGRGVTTADAFAAVITEYLLYTAMAACLAIVALSLLLARHALPPGIRSGAVAVIALMSAFLAAIVFAAITGIGLIGPSVRASGAVIGRRRAQRAADAFAPVEDRIIGFLRGHHERLAEVVALEATAHLLLVVEIWVLVAALGFSRSWSNAIIVEGGVKFVAIVFAFVPGQFGASEGTYALLAAAIGLSTAAGLSLALVRRLRGLLVAAGGVLALTIFGDR